MRAVILTDTLVGTISSLQGQSFSSAVLNIELLLPSQLPPGVRAWRRYGDGTEGLWGRSHVDRTTI